jgi:hypothetical protein
MIGARVVIPARRVMFIAIDRARPTVDGSRDRLVVIAFRDRSAVHDGKEQR